MDDERFDLDLEAVLREEAPRDVPDDLRRRVAAIAMTSPDLVHVARPFWRHPGVLWVAAASAVVLVVVVASWRTGPVAPSGVGAASDSPAPTESPGIQACVGADLTGRILDWQGAAGSRVATVAVTNTTAAACLIRGTPGLRLVDDGGRVLVDSAAAGSDGQPHVTTSDSAFELASGTRLGTEVRVSNYCGPAPKLPLAIEVLLASGSGPVVAAAGPGVSSADGVPPCLGSSGGRIDMNGWRR